MKSVINCPDCNFRKKILEAHFHFNSKRTIYLDYNATTPVDTRVLGAFERSCREVWANPSSLHLCGVKSWEMMDSFRKNIAAYFGCSPKGLFFCSSGSEAVHCAVAGFRKRNPKSAVIISTIEHSSVRHPFRISQLCGLKGKAINVDSEGRLDCEMLEDVLKLHKGSLIVISPVNHETGALQPVETIYTLSKKYDSLLFLDAVQAAAKLAPEKWAPFCDFFCVSGHKIYAPKGIALLWKKEGVKLDSFRFGGSQEGGFFPGTENTPGIAALSSSLSLLREEGPAEMSRLCMLSGEGLTILKNASFPFILESPEHRAPGILCISLSWVDEIEKLLYTLNLNSICLSRFSACTGRVDGPSRVLLAMGRSRKQASTSLRISLGRWSKRDDFFRLTKVLQEVYGKN